MIAVEYDPAGSLRVTGHAGYAPHGSDVVCAAASMLLYTLAASVQRMQESGLVARCSIDLREGAGTVLWEPNAKWRGEVRLVTDSLCLGFRLLARDYGEHVRFNE